MNMYILKVYTLRVYLKYTLTLRESQISESFVFLQVYFYPYLYEFKVYRITPSTLTGEVSNETGEIQRRL